ncbi:MAG: hypothetical protein ABI876_14410, partial [Bacteroidota bacterium]
LLITGMRDGEILKITRKEAKGDFLMAISKVQRTKRAIEVKREIPINHLPGLREVLDRLLALPPSPQSHRSDYLLPFATLNKLRKQFNRALEYSAIEPMGRTLNCCRKSTIWWLEDELLWDRQDIIDMIGHSEEIDDKYYRDRPKGQALESRIKRRFEARDAGHLFDRQGHNGKEINSSVVGAHHHTSTGIQREQN